VKFRSYIFLACNLLLFCYMAGAYLLPNAVNYVVPAALMLLTTALLRHPVQQLGAVLIELRPIVLYFAYFIVSASWALFPDHSLRNILIHSTFLFASVMFALLVRYASFTSVVTCVHIAVYSALAINVMVISGVASSTELTRIGGSSIPMLAMLLPYMIVYESKSLVKKYLPILLTIALLVISMNRTPLVAGMIGAALAIAYTQRSALRAAVKLMTFSVLGACALGALMLVPVVNQFAAQSVQRLTRLDFAFGDDLVDNAEVDLLRWTIFEEANRLYPQYWFEGMGYMGFMPWYGGEFETVSYSDAGKEIVGVNLHNSFQTWGLEGGIGCVLIIVYMLYRYYRMSREKMRLATSRYERNFHAAGLIIAVPFGMYAMFHQLHQAPVFYVILGIVLARGTEPVVRTEANPAADNCVAVAQPS
jgi:hypothetical protein